MKLKNACTIKIQNFEGPFDLLFYLIEKNKFSIYDIPISEITDQYMEYINAMQELDLEITSEFLVLASTLLQIKSKKLLPEDKKDDCKQDLEIDPEKELIRKLENYKKFKDFSSILKDRNMEFNKIFYKPEEQFCFKKEFAPIELPFELLKELYIQILTKNKQKLNNTEVKMMEILKREKVSLKSKIKEIIQNFSGKVFFRFSELFSIKTKSKLEVVTGFLAILELSKLKKVDLVQKKLFSEIVIYKGKKLSDNSSEEMLG